MSLKKNQKKKSSVILRVTIFAVSVCMIISLCGLWRELIIGQNSLARLEQIKAEKISQIESLTALLESGNENEIIEKAARERLGFVYADEQVYIDISGN